MNLFRIKYFDFNENKYFDVNEVRHCFSASITVQIYCCYDIHRFPALNNAYFFVLYTFKRNSC